MQIEVTQSSMRHAVSLGAKIFLDFSFKEKMTVILPTVVGVAKLLSYVYQPAQDFVDSARQSWKPWKAVRIWQGDSKAQKLGLIVNWTTIAMLVHGALPYIRRYAPIILSIQNPHVISH